VAQPASIELRTGADVAYRVVVTVLWLLAILNILAHAGSMAWPWMMLAALLLVWLNPWYGWTGRQQGRVRIFRDGSAIIANGHVAWKGSGWCNRWATLLRLESPAGGRTARTSHILVCASSNTPDSYRRLLVWCRFPPGGAYPGRNGPRS
jgi:hypothetical protein